MRLSFLPPKSAAPGPPRPAESPPAHFFNCSRRAEKGGSIRLLLDGELDLAAVAQFRAALDAAQDDSGRVVLDLGALSLIDCAALSVLAVAADRRRRDGAVLIFLSPQGQVRRVLKLIGAPAGVAMVDREDLPEAGVRAAA
jgi:anti-anti-sigma factor